MAIDRLGFNRVQTGSETGSNGFSSSSSKDLSNTTTTSGLSENWNKVEFSQIESIGFREAHVKQIALMGLLTPDTLQESINAFVFDLEVNQKTGAINGSALNFFMGILRKGPYVPPDNYEPPQARQMREYLEAREQQQKKRQEMEARLEKVEFEEWETKLSIEEKVRLVPPLEFAKPGGQGYQVQLKQYFREKKKTEKGFLCCPRCLGRPSLCCPCCRLLPCLCRPGCPCAARAPAGPAACAAGRTICYRTGLQVTGRSPCCVPPGSRAAAVPPSRGARAGRGGWVGG